MIRAVVTGRLHGDPKQRTGQSGKPFVTAGAWVDVDAEQRIWASLIAFGSAGERLMLLKAGDAAAFAGRLTPSLYEREKPRVSLDLVVDEVAAVRRKPKAKPQPAEGRNDDFGPDAGRFD